MKKGGDARWHGVGMVIGRGQGFYRVELGRRLMRVAPAQLRMASPEELRSRTIVPGELLTMQERMERKLQGTRG